MSSDVQLVPGIDYCDSYFWPNLDPDPHPYLCSLPAGHDGDHEAHTTDGDEISAMPARIWARTTRGNA